MPEPVLISIAAAAAGRAVTGLYKLIKAKFADDPEATAVFEAAEGTAEDSQEVRKLAATLEKKQQADPMFGEQLRDEWERASVVQRAESAGVTNQISGNVSGKVLQARDIHGDISF